MIFDLFELPDFERIQIITEYDQMVMELDKRRMEIWGERSSLTDEQIDKNAQELAEIGRQQGPMVKKAQEIRALVVTLADAGIYWLALQAQCPDDYQRLADALEPVVQEMRERSKAQAAIQ